MRTQRWVMTLVIAALCFFIWCSCGTLWKTGAVAGATAGGAAVGGPVGAGVAGGVTYLVVENYAKAEQIEVLQLEVRELRNAIVTAQVTGRPIELPGQETSGYPFGWSGTRWLIILGAALFAWLFPEAVGHGIALVAKLPMQARKTVAAKIRTARA